VPGVPIGDTAMDRISGFKGTVVARCEYLHSEPRCLLRASVTAPSTGLPVEEWFEERELLVDEGEYLDRALSSRHNK
jgi:hypothetical protein